MRATGVRGDGENNVSKMEAMIRAAFDNPVGTEPLRDKLRKLRQLKGDKVKASGRGAEGFL